MWWPFRKAARDGEPRHLRVGEWGEAEAARYLKKQGFKVLGRRVRIGRSDELDLVCRDGVALVFVEVKTRRSEAFGRAASAVDRRKRLALSRAAIRYLKRLKEQPDCFRFDVVEVIGSPEEGVETVRHIENVFPLEGRLRPPP